MPGELIQANTIPDYWEKIKKIYENRSSDWKDLTKEQYEAIDRSEREDSDNHLNKERLEKEDAKVIDICHYKSLPDRVTAYHIEILDAKLNSEHLYFQITLAKNID